MIDGTEYRRSSMPTLRAGVLVLLAVVAMSPRPSAQSLPIALFDRYLASLREETGIQIVGDAGIETAVAAFQQIQYPRRRGSHGRDYACRLCPPFPLRRIKAGRQGRMRHDGVASRRVRLASLETRGANAIS